MPQFQIRRHPHGFSWELFHLSSGKWHKTYAEANSVQELMDSIVDYLAKNSFRMKAFVEVLSD